MIEDLFREATKARGNFQDRESALSEVLGYARRDGYGVVVELLEGAIVDAYVSPHVLESTAYLIDVGEIEKRAFDPALRGIVDLRKAFDIPFQEIVDTMKWWL